MTCRKRQCRNSLFLAEQIIKQEGIFDPFAFMCYDIFSLYIIAETCISVCSTDNTDKGIHKLKPRAKDEILN